MNTQGWRKQFYIGQANPSSMNCSYMCEQDHLQNLENLAYECTDPIVRSTISMQSMLMLGGSGGSPPGKF